MTKITSTAEIRSAFLRYFEQHNHQVVPSSSLVPVGDPTLFFTNAGMVQFKALFLGAEKRSYTRAASAQRCLRASGKHNDLGNVGYTTRHHTFFEMLGNFSFGDYFKTEAIHYAWEFLTEELGIDPKRLWITVHKKDLETEQLWQQEFKSSNKAAQGLSHCDDQDNFWAMGETGPCGYCSEIFYDHGEHFPGDPPGGKTEGERYVEIWNLVFMQFERDNQSKLAPLPKPSIDTGMGLERIAAVMQGVHDNYDIDIFAELKATFFAMLKNHHGTKLPLIASDEAKIAARVVVDHIRSAAFLIADGVIPSNEKSGYVLRSIIRRAVYYLYRLDIRDPFFFRLVDPLIKIFSPVYPEMKLDQLQNQIVTTLQQEEGRFLETLDRGLKILAGELQKLKGKIIPGIVAFTLHDTYGLPIILTEEIAKKHGLTVDHDGFEHNMNQQRENSKAALKNKLTTKLAFDIENKTDFVGYDIEQTQSKVIAIFKPDGAPTTTITAGEDAIVILDITPFYGESGGQVGDSGEIFAGAFTFLVNDTQKQDGTQLHYGQLKNGSISVGELVTAKIDADRRERIRLNHSATHLLHKSLRMTLGDSATQRGSAVDDQRLRFDFAYPIALTKEQIDEIEKLVNQHVRSNLEVHTELTSLEEAKRSGAAALFGEKYGDEVRVVSMGDFSKELCGGTHVKHTGNIGLFKIINESSIAAGIRRIEATTGENAIFIISKIAEQLKEVARVISANPVDLVTKLHDLLNNMDLKDKELKLLRKEINAIKIKKLIENAVRLGDNAIIIANLGDIDAYSMKEMVENIKNTVKTTIVVLSSIKDEKVHLIVGVTDNLTDRLGANILLEYLIKQIAGSGGGRKEIAQGGGTANNSSLQEALDSVLPWIKEKLNY